MADLSQAMGNMGNLLSGFFWVIIIISGVLIGGVIVFVGYQLLTYNIKVYVLEVVGKTAKVSMDNGKLVTKDGVSKFRLLKAKKKLNPPDSASYMMAGSKKAVVYLKKGNDYQPVSLTSDLATLEIIPEELKFWFVQEQKEAVTAYMMRDKLMQILPIAGWIVSMVIVFLIFVLLFKRVDHMMEMASAKAIERACSQEIPAMGIMLPIPIWRLGK